MDERELPQSSPDNRGQRDSNRSDRGRSDRGDQDPSSHAESLVDSEEAGASVGGGVGDKRENSAQTAGSVSPSTGGRKYWWVGIITLLLLFVVALVITFARRVRPFDSEEVSSDAGTSQRDDQAERTGNVRSAREGGPPRQAVQQDRDDKPPLTPDRLRALPTPEARMAALREEAISVARQLVADFSDRAEAEGLLAVAYSRFGRAEEAEAAWKRSLTLDPEFAEAYDGLGKLELERGNYEPAVDYFRQALAAGDAVADVRPALAEALTNLQRLTEAVTVLEEQLRRVPADALSHFRLGQAYAMLREFDQARRCFEATLRVDPDNTYAYYGLSTTCRRLGDTQSADTYLQSFQRRKQEDLAAELKRVKTFDDQQQVLQGTSFIQKKAGSLYARLHNLRKAERVWVQAARLNPHDIEVRLQLASLYVQTQQFDQAAATFDELRQREPDNPDYCLQQGIIHAQRGRFVDAESAFQRAVQLRPEHAGSYAAFAQLYLRSGARLDECSGCCSGPCNSTRIRDTIFFSRSLVSKMVTCRVRCGLCRKRFVRNRKMWIISERAMRCGNRSSGCRATGQSHPRAALAKRLTGRGDTGRGDTGISRHDCATSVSAMFPWVVYWVFSCSCTAVLAQFPIQLRDVTRQTGIAFRHTDGSTGRRYIVETVSAGLAAFDYDGDGLCDIYFVNGAPLGGATGEDPPRNALYRNWGNWRFEDVTRQAGVGDTGFGLGVAVADYDEDGFLDLYVTNFGPNVLYRNNGDGTFSDVTNQAGVGAGEKVGAGACFLDMDNDGDLDLYSANYIQFSFDTHVARTLDGFPEYAGPKDYPPDPDVLFRNNADGTFTDVSLEAGIGTKAGSGMGMVCADYDRDGDTDVFVLNDVAGNFVFRNDGSGKFEEVGLLVGMAYNLSGHELGSMGIDCGDIDNDGWLDFYQTSYEGELPVLYRNLGDGFLEDATLPSGAGAGGLPYVNWGVGLIDFDNDGHRDLYFANGHLQDNIDQYSTSSAYAARNVLLRNTGQGHFDNVSDQAGDGMLAKYSSRGAVFEDLDNDGTVDVVVLNSRREATVLRNQSATGHHWIELTLRGAHSNRTAVGAQATVIAGDLVQVAEVHSGRGYQSHWGPRLHFGLGLHARVDRVEVRWIGGGTEVFLDMAVDQQLQLTEGQGQPVRRPSR